MLQKQHYNTTSVTITLGKTVYCLKNVYFHYIQQLLNWYFFQNMYTLKYATFVSLYPYNLSQILQYFKYTK